MLVPIQLLGILAVNLVPVAGVLWFGWSAFEVIFLYWFENVAIAVSHYLKMRMCARTINDTEGLSTANFFLLHYGIFTFVHGVFVISLFGIVANGFATYRGGLPLPIFLIMAWQFVSLFIDAALTSRFKDQKAGDMLFQPYPRMLALHITIIAAGWFIAEAGSPIWALLLLVLLKTLIDTGLFFISFSGKPDNIIAALRKNTDRAPH